MTQLVLLLIFLNLPAVQDHEPELVFIVEIPDDLQLLRVGLDFPEAFLEHEVDYM